MTPRLRNTGLPVPIQNHSSSGAYTPVCAERESVRVGLNKNVGRVSQVSGIFIILYEEKREKKPLMAMVYNKNV